MNNKRGKPFWIACNEGDKAKVEKYLRNPLLDANYSHRKRTPIQTAAENGHLEIVKLLAADDRVELNPRVTFESRTPLDYAAKKGNLDMFNVLLANPKAHVSHNTLIGVVSHKNPAMLRAFLGCAQFRNGLNNPNSSAFFKACRKGNVEVVRMLLADPRITVTSKKANLDDPKTSALAEVCRNSGPPTGANALLDSDDDFDFFIVESDGDEDGDPFLPPPAAAIDSDEEADLDVTGEEGAIVGLVPGAPPAPAPQANAEPAANDEQQAPAEGEAPLQSHLEVVKLLLASPRIPVATDSKTPITPFAHACHKGNLEVVKLLLADARVEVVETCNPMTPSYPRPQASTILHVTCQAGQVEVMKLLLESPRINVGAISKRFNSLIRLAEQTNDTAMLEILLADERVQIEQEKTEPVICLPCATGRLQALELLLNSPRVDFSSLWVSADPSSGLMQGKRPLCVAVSEGQLEIVTHLITLQKPGIRVDVNIRSSSGATPLRLACEKGHREIMAALLALSQIDVDTTNLEGLTAFQTACSSGAIAIVEILLADGRVNTNHRSKKGDTALHLAAKANRVDIVEALLQIPDIDINVQNNEGLTPFFIAYQSRAMAVAERLLKDDRLDLSETNTSLLNLLSACEAGSAPLVEVLLRDKRTDLNSGLNEAFGASYLSSPVGVACTKNHTSVLLLLIADSRVRLEPGLVDDVLSHSVSNANRVKIVQILMTSSQLLQLPQQKWTDLVGRARRANHLELAQILEGYSQNSDLQRTRQREILGVSARFSAEVLGLVVFLCDLHLKVKHQAGKEARFFSIAQRLPFELQMVLCNRVFGRLQDSITLPDREAAFKSLGKVFRGSQSKPRFFFFSFLFFFLFF